MVRGSRSRPSSRPTWCSSATPRRACGRLPTGRSQWTKHQLLAGMGSLVLYCSNYCYFRPPSSRLSRFLQRGHCEAARWGWTNLAHLRLRLTVEEGTVIRDGCRCIRKQPPGPDLFSRALKHAPTSSSVAAFGILRAIPDTSPQGIGFINCLA